MNKTVIALMAAFAGSVGTWGILHNNAEPSAGTAASPALTGSNAKLLALEHENAQLREQLAKQKKASAPVSTDAGAPADAVRDVAAVTRERERAEVLQRRREALEKRLEETMLRLTAKLSLTPEQAEATQEWHRSFLEAQLAASFKSPRDPRDYRLGAFRQDLPAAVQTALSPDQQAIWQKHDQDARADSAEIKSNGEMAHLTRALGITREQKDLIFPHLSQLHLKDTVNDFSNVVDLTSLGAQVDTDSADRRQFYTSILTPDQMAKWETIAAEYKIGVLRPYSPAATAPATP